LFAIERQQTIINLVNEKGNVTIAELTALFAVSAETIRKDLLLLEQEKKLTRTHGGAVRYQSVPGMVPLRERKKNCLSEKRELCQYALQFIKNGDTIAIDEGSTAVELATLLACMYSTLKVVTHSLEVFEILSKNPGIELILCAGEFLPEEKAFIGSLTINALRQLHIKKAFLFPAAISLQFGIMDHSKDLSAVQKTYLEISEELYFLADHEKFEQGALYQLTGLHPGMVLITDSGLSEELYQNYQEKEIRIVKEKEV